MNDEHCGVIAIDWSKFFDSIERDVAHNVTKALMGQDSTENALGYIDAEHRLISQSRFRFKVGGSVEEESKQRTNWYAQGPSWSINQAFSLMAVWTGAVQHETIGIATPEHEGVRTAGFIDDTRFRSKGGDVTETVLPLAKAMEVSEEF